MEWATLAGAALGAVMGAGATLLGEQLRWRRTTSDNRLQDLRNLYADCLVSL
ncbi:hypothetical protein [Streptomyces sp. NPDC050982]|uniref:hypothetical protein n=1 Tax=Streptomyces sp. NPDC050982 TaxID=3154746 RepID=UPI0034086C21